MLIFAIFRTEKNEPKIVLHEDMTNEHVIKSHTLCFVTIVD